MAKLYRKPSVEIFPVALSNVMQIVEKSGEGGPWVNPNNPIDNPDPDDLPSNNFKIWEDNYCVYEY